MAPISTGWSTVEARRSTCDSDASSSSYEGPDQLYEDSNEYQERELPVEIYNICSLALRRLDLPSKDYDSLRTCYVVFKKYDQNHPGVMRRQDIKNAVKDLGIEPLSEREFQALIQEQDKPCLNLVDFSQFMIIACQMEERIAEIQHRYHVSLAFFLWMPPDEQHLSMAQITLQMIQAIRFLAQCNYIPPYLKMNLRQEYSRLLRPRDIIAVHQRPPFIPYVHRSDEFFDERTQIAKFHLETRGPEAASLRNMREHFYTHLALAFLEDWTMDYV